MRARVVVASLAAGAVLFAVTWAQAGGDPAAKCKEAKAKAAGQKVAAFLKAIGKQTSKYPRARLRAQMARAQARFTRAFSKAERKGGCEVDGDVQRIEDKVDDFVTDTVTILSRFVDNGDGTITDPGTGLMWEKKDEGGGLHDVGNRYTWAGCCDGNCSPLPDQLCQPNAAAAGACSAQTGGAPGCAECLSGTCDVDPRGWGAVTTIWDWVVQVNGEGGSGFAGHSDWRIPSEDGCNSCYSDSRTKSCPCAPAELERILLEPYQCLKHPCIDGIFGPTAASGYWSSTTLAYNPGYAWVVYFFAGNVNFNGKDSNLYVRAVRGGS